MAQERVTKEELRRQVRELAHELDVLKNAAVESERYEKDIGMFHAIIETMDDGLMIEDQRGRVSFVNQAMVRMLEYGNADQILGRPWGDFFSLEAEKKLADKAGHYESLLLTSQGHKIPIRINSTSFYYKDEYIGVLSVISDISVHKAAEAAIRDSETRLRNLSQTLIAVHEEERAALTRELHDELGQHLTSLNMEIAWLKKQQQPSESDYDSLGEKVKNVSGELRRIYRGLRPVLLDRLGLSSALEDFIKSFSERRNIQIHVELIDLAPQDLAPDAALNVFRVVQESMTNVARHSEAERVEVCMEIQGETLQVTIRDNGKGFDPARAARKKSMGLLGMRERATSCGGKLSIKTTPDEGTTVLVRVPLAENTKGEKP